MPKYWVLSLWTGLCLDLVLLLWLWTLFGFMAKELRGPNLRNNWDRGSLLCFSRSSVKLAIYSGHAGLCLCVYTVNTYSKDDVTLDLVRGKYSVFNTGSIQWIIEDHAFSILYDLAPRTPSTPSPVTVTHVTQEDWERERTCCREMGERGWARSRIIRTEESLILY